MTSPEHQTQNAARAVSPAPTALSDTLARRLRRLARRVRAQVVLDGLAAWMALAAALAVAQLLLDFSLHIRWSIRGMLTTAAAGALAWTAWRRLVRPMRMAVGPVEAARLVERTAPELASLLISAVRFSAGQIGEPASNSPALAAAVVQRANELAAAVDFRRPLQAHRVRRAVMILTGLAAGAALAAQAAPQVVAVWFQRNVLLADVEWPRRTRLIVDLPDGVLRGAVGDDLEIAARVEGVVPRQVDVVFETASGRAGRESMTAVGVDGLRYTLRNAREDFKFHLEGGDDRTRTFRAVLSERPRVSGSHIRIVPPAYTGLEATTLGDGQRSAQVLLGSEVTIDIRTARPVAAAVLTAGDEPIMAARPAERHPLETGATPEHGLETGATAWTVTIRPRETRTYHFALTDPAGLTDRRPVRFAIRVERDEPPMVRLKIPGAGESITPAAVLPLELECADTYGLASVEIVAQSTRGAGGSPIAVNGLTKGSPEFAAELAWPAAALAAEPGDRITLFARASDADDVSGPNVAQSPPITLRVVSREEFLADLARREQEHRIEFERLIDAQEDVRRRWLTVVGALQRLGAAEDWSAIVAPLERRQRSAAGAVGVVAQKFEQILMQLRMNQLETPLERERIGEGIVAPLSDLARRDLKLAADQLRRAARERRLDEAAAIDAGQAELIERMRAVLARMIQWEGFQEALTLLREIVALQRDVNEQTQDEVERQGEGIFDE